jgi:hypothetical protein
MASKNVASEAVERQQEVQKQVDRADATSGKGDICEGAMQAGARLYPVPPFPAQHQMKPGDETTLDPSPLYDAPFYVGSQKLEGKIALITGGDSGIGRAVAVLFAREGAHIAISYLSETKDAETTRAAIEKEGRRCLLLSGNVG